MATTITAFVVTNSSTREIKLFDSEHVALSYCDGKDYAVVEGQTTLIIE